MTMEMTEGQSSDPSVGATADMPVAWHQINWRQAERNARRLQTRIAQATQAGKWGKVKALQRLLTHSFSGKALAVRRVTENTGKRTPGVDGEIWKTPEQKAEAIQSLTQQGYHPLPLRRVYIPKSNGVLTTVYNWFSQLSGEALVIFVAPATLHRKEFAGGGRECQQHRWYHSPMAWKSSR